MARIGICQSCGNNGEKLRLETYADGTKIDTCRDCARKRGKIRDERNRQWQEIRLKVLPDVIIKSEGQCIKCGSTEKLTIDHIIPRTRGGTDSLENLQILCRRCNEKKGAR